ncbi:hypothetical protein GQ42DRAFT_112789, partial [Ramicandelaber brevisporus]
HIQVVIDQYVNLQVELAVQTWSDRRIYRGVRVAGMIPVVYRSRDYNIQIEIWVPPEYPQRPPEAKVVPSGDIVVKPSAIVEPDGQLKLPYLVEWR